MQLKTPGLRTNFYRNDKNGLEKNTNKFDSIAFRGGAHIQQGFIKFILNLTGGEYRCKQ